MQVKLDNYLARPAPDAPGAAAPERTAARPDRRDHRRLRARSTTPPSARSTTTRIGWSPATAASSPSCSRCSTRASTTSRSAEQHEHRLARPAHVPAEPGRAAARRAGAVEPRGALHHDTSAIPREAVSCRTCSTFPTLADIHLEHEVVAVDPRATDACASPTARPRATTRWCRRSPLPDLIPMIAGAPRDVRRRVAPAGLLDLRAGQRGRRPRRSVRRRRSPTSTTRTSGFTRLSFPHMLSTTNAPDGCGSIQAEVYFSTKYKPLDACRPNRCIDRVIADLQEGGRRARKATRS